MFKLWGKIIKNNRIIQSYTSECDNNNLSKKELVNICLEEICREFDIQKPLWLPIHEKDFNRYYKAKFNADAFMEEIEFDAFEIEFVEEQKKKK